MENKNFIFFLGGYDAEMCEIRKILEQHQLTFYDKQLSWGAKLSSYEDELNSVSENEIPVFIELELDINYPQQIIIIDHHDLDSGKDKPSAIEQVAKLIGVELNRWQKLIAANDVAWIDGLIKAGATGKEITKIRSYDRKCQVIEDKAELEAQEAIKKMKAFGSLAIVEIPHSHASAVFDRLYNQFENILVFSPNETNFSGRGEVVKKLSVLYENCWYGGALPNKGFWGFPLKNLQIESMIKKLLNNINQ